MADEFVSLTEERSQGSNSIFGTIPIMARPLARFDFCEHVVVGGAGSSASIENGEGAERRSTAEESTTSAIHTATSAATRATETTAQRTGDTAVFGLFLAGEKVLVGLAMCRCDASR